MSQSSSPYDGYKPYPVQAKIDPSDPLYVEYEKQLRMSQQQQSAKQDEREDPSTFDAVKATQFGYYERVQQLIESGHDVNQLDGTGVSLLHWAAINNKKQIARLLLDHGAVIDRFGGELNSSPLHWATRQGHLAMVVFLITNGADPSAEDGEGYQCLHLASMYSHSSVVAYLVAKGYDVDTKDKSGMTPLMWACYRSGSIDPTRLLITLGADVNKKDTAYGNTALHWSLISGNNASYTQLCNHNIDFGAKNLAGHTALDIALQKNNRWLINKIQMMKLERGFDNPGFIPSKTAYNSKFREKYMMLYPFFALWAIGWTFEIHCVWWIRIFLLATIFLTYKYSKRWLFDDRLSETAPFGLYLATKFWMHFTWFTYALPYVGNIFIHGLFLLNSLTLCYFYYKSVTDDPGFIKPSRQQQVQTILQLSESEKFLVEAFCSSCLIQKPQRSKHCSTCNKCVAKFDHHCPWIYNCVGAGNMKFFLMYLVYLIGMILWCMYGCICFWRFGCDYPSGGVHYAVYYAVESSPWVAWIFLNSCFYIVFVGVLLMTLLYQSLYLGLTTNERLNLYRYKHFLKDGKFTNPYSRGVIQNCIDETDCSCLGLFRPTQNDWKTIYIFPGEKTTV